MKQRNFPISGKALTSLLIGLTVGWAVIKALKWPFNTALFPVVIGIPVFSLAMTELWFSLSEEVKAPKGLVAADAGREKKGSESLPVKKTALAFLMILGFFFLILLIGFSAAVPVFVFLYLKVHGKEKWLLSVGLAVIAWACFYGLFIRVLNIPFEDGWVQQGLSALSIR